MEFHDLAISVWWVLYILKNCHASDVKYHESKNKVVVQKDSTPILMAFVSNKTISSKSLFSKSSN